MKTVIFESSDWSMPVAETLDALELEETPQPLTASNAEAYADMEVACVFLGSRLDEATLRQLPRLRYIVTRSTGFDHIDTAFCQTHGLGVCNVPSYGSPTIAEHTFALLLMIAHRMTEATARTKALHFSFEGLRGFDLAGKILGVIGTGAIGRSVVEIAQGFNMRICAVDTNPDISFAHDRNFKYLPLERLLQNSDIVSLHVPLTRDTRNMINRTTFGQMKKGAVLINTARGEIVDQAALLEALNSGKVAAAGLDVLADEQLLRSQNQHHQDLSLREQRSLGLSKTLLQHPSVVATPHSAFNTQEALARINGISLKNIIAILNDHPINVVTRPQT